MTYWHFWILGNPRPTITWFKDGAELYQHRFFQVTYEINTLNIYIKFLHLQVHESHIEANIVKSKMEIDPTTQMDAGKFDKWSLNVYLDYMYILLPIFSGFYECQADNIYAIDRRGFRTDYVMVNFWEKPTFQPLQNPLTQ